MKKFCDHAIAFFLALVSAALVAYSMAHFVHSLRSWLFSIRPSREQALICAAVIIGLVMIEMLMSTKDTK